MVKGRRAIRGHLLATASHGDVRAIAESGFVIEQLVEPEPLASLADSDPVAYEEISTKPRFLFFCLRPSAIAK